MKLERWTVPTALLESPEVVGRNALAEKYKNASVSEILGNYAGYSLQDARVFYPNLLPKLGVDLEGVGIELGAGVACFSASVIAQFPKVTKMYAVEIVPRVVECLQEKVASEIAPASRQKLIRVIGSFDDIELPQDSVDFAVEIESFHHSHNLERTLREANRVLKPGAPLIIVDRICSDSMPDAQREYLLDFEYSTAWRKTNGYDINAKITRRMNGEHEIRRAEWLDALTKSGFRVEREMLVRTADRQRILKCLVSMVPFGLRKHLGYKFARFVRCPSGELWWLIQRCVLSGRGLSPRILEIPAETQLQKVVFAKSVLVCRKASAPVHA